MQNLKKIIVVVLFSLAIVNPSLVFAQAKTTPAAVDIPTYQGVDSSLTSYLCTPDPTGKDNHALENCVNKLYRFGISFGAIALVFFIVFAGYMYITGGETGKTKAKDMLQNALIGISLLLGSYLILSFINPSLVIFKPIQPPIFTAADIYSCEEVGFGETCVLPNGDVVQGSGGTWGNRIPCPGRKLVSAKGLGLKTKAADEQICEDFGKRLVQLQNITKDLNWYITDTIGSGHGSSCHSAGNDLSGTCADIGLPAKTTENFNKLCKAMFTVGQLQPVNETEDPKVTECEKLHNYGGTGPHIHTNWRNGGGGGGGSTSSSGPRPNCIATLVFLCAHPPESSGSYPARQWEDSKYVTDATIKSNLKDLHTKWDALQALRRSKNRPIPAVDQVYRPLTYSSHMRSVYEAFVLSDVAGINMSDAQLQQRNSTYAYHNYQCSGVQFVKKADVANLTAEQKAYIKTHAANHGINKANSTTTDVGSMYDSACISDHGAGTAFDLEVGSYSASAKQQLKADAYAVGLCHNIPYDTRHFNLTLASKVPNPAVDCLK